MTEVERIRQTERLRKRRLDGVKQVLVCSKTIHSSQQVEEENLQFS